MNRRQALSLLGSAAFGGCLSDTSGSGTTSETPTNETTTDPITETPSRTTTEPPELGVQNPEECPKWGENYVVCSPRADSPMVLDGSSDSETLPKAKLSFTLENTTNLAFASNFYGWKLWKRVKGAWYHVTPSYWPAPLHTLESGGSHTWTLTVDNTDLDQPIPTAQGTEDISVPGLGAGTYALGVSGWFRGQSDERQIAFVRRFELTGDSLELTPVGIESVERNDGTVVVTTTKSNSKKRLTATRVGDPPEEPKRVVTEQVLRTTAVRNALAHFEAGVETVRVENAREEMASVILATQGPTYVRYDGDTYKVETSEETADG
ncbi:hypothetical protein [Halorussus halophilus]|uniref:hypothetical protein n=1 Tax=Halorussus halophilus TaxID=2650975 RepID=UPI001301744E|nr:hypothetical protein [Halorussus halophilus]